ncbi:MAG: class I SAM-dependent methyltransferase [Chloroflexi bacterium]|nr:class I SAM-dependent methyltransferase [Chloroflexota bacterium]
MKMYNELASWWPLLSPPDDYAAEAAIFGQIFVEAGLPPAPTLLELGSGGGHNAFHLKALFAQVTLADLSPQMLAVSRALNPDCEHVEGDMRQLRLGRLFDVVFVHDAIDYMTSLEALKQAIETAFVHCRPGGVALFVPDHVRETFEPETEHGGTDGNGRGLRYLEWTYDPDETDTTYTVEYVYALREDGQPLHVEAEQHLFGLFARAEWLQVLGEVGFLATQIQDEYGRELFVGRKPLG